MKTASKRWVWPLVAGWVVLLAVAPVLISACLFGCDLAGVGVLLGFLALGTLPALVLGFLLGRVHAWSALAAAAAAGMAALLVGFAFAGDPNVDTDAMAALFAIACFLLLFIALPLVVGSGCGALCRAGQTCWTARR